MLCIYCISDVIFVLRDICVIIFDVHLHFGDSFCFFILHFPFQCLFCFFEIMYFL